MVVAVRDLGPDDFDYACAGLDQTARQQEALTESVHAITLAHLRVLTIHLEGFASFAADDEIKGFAVVLIEIVIRDSLLDVRHGVFHGIAQACTALETRR